MFYQKNFKSIDIDKKDINGITALTAASDCGHFDTVKYLIQHGASVNQTILNGWTPLAYAASQGHIQIVKCLIKYGALVNTKNEQDYTALIWTSIEGHYDILKYLIKHGATITDKLFSGDTVITKAISYNSKLIVLYLKKIVLKRIKTF